MKIKPHLALDGYKTGHKFQYPKGTEVVNSNLTARSSRLAKMPDSFDEKVVVAGIQGFIKEFIIEQWNDGFFNRPKDVVVREYKRRMDNYLGTDAVDVTHIDELHDLGYLPIVIKALPEGSRVDMRVPFMTVENTLPQFYWLTNYIETVWSDEIWKMVTVATLAYEYRRILNKYVDLTGASKEFADWQLHDFSMRGLSGLVDAAKVGAAHLMAAGFGTDTLPAIDYLEEYYNANSDIELVGGSVPATEHSVMCMGGMETEIETFHRLITEVYPSGIVSIVSDTWDFWNVITNTAAQLKDVILNRTPNALGFAKVVFRPDSGDPVKIVTGLKAVEIFDIDELTWIELYDEIEEKDIDVILYNGKYFEFDIIYDRFDDYIDAIKLTNEVPEHIVKGAVECLWDIFGGDTNEKGFRTLNQRVGLIYGDSITLERCEQILQRLMDKGFTASNIVFGIGSYTYQYVTRDTFGMAVKATFGVVNGEDRELFKDPKTGDGMKKSARGLLRVEYEDGKFVLYDQQTREQEKQGCLREVFRDGKLLIDENLSTIRERLKQ